MGSGGQRCRRQAGIASVIAAFAALFSAPACAADVEPGLHGISGRNVGIARAGATQQPRGENDQALVDGWPLYRTERGQEAFNHAMATLKATAGPAPAASQFKGCADLACNLTLPALDSEGWISPGRLWVSPGEYVIIARSPRLAEGASYKRRSRGGMRVFVFHEFQNNNFNTDLYDTISAHARSVFVPFYIGKTMTDAEGRKFVVLVQVAPHDVVSRHASNMGSAGPGVEVAKNTGEDLEPLQATAGVLLATIVKKAAPQLKVVHHRNVEGLPMLNAYERRLARLRARSDAAALALPFVPARSTEIAGAATSRLDELVSRGGASAPLAIAQRAFVPARASITMPELIGPIRLAVRPPAVRPAAAVPARSYQPVLIGPIRLATRRAAAHAIEDSSSQ